MEELVLSFGLYYLLFAFILFFLLRKYLLSVFDPFLFTILMMASSLSLSTDSPFFLYVALSILAFILGFKFVKLAKRNDEKIEKPNENENLENKKSE